MGYSIKIVRLLGNQDLIAKVDVRRDNGRIVYRLVDAFSLMIVPVEEPASNLVSPGQPPRMKLNVQLDPFLAIYMNEKKYIDLDQFHVLFLSDPKPGILDFYNRRTSSLILPQTDGTILPAQLDKEDKTPSAEDEVDEALAAAKEKALAGDGPTVELKDVPEKSE